MSTFKLTQRDQVPAGPRTSAPPPPARGTRLTEDERRARERGDVDVRRWWEHASCKGQGTKASSVWHEPWNHPATVVHTAIATCLGCPVLEQCAKEPVIGPGLTASYVWVINANNRLVVQNARLCAWCRRSFYGKTPKARCCSSACRSKIGTYEGRTGRQERLKDADPIGEREPTLDPVPLLSQLGQATTAEMAERCGVTVRTIMRWRWGGVIRRSTAISVCRRLRIDPERVWSTWT